MRSIASSAVCLVFLSLGCDKIRLPTEPSQCATDVGMPGQITGTVLSDSGSPVSDAHVTLSGTSTTSDGAGRFSLDAPSGPATLEIDAPGYVPAQGNIVVTAGTGAIRAVLPRGYGSVIVLFGRVLESCSGSPIAGARVGVPGGFATSASDGNGGVSNSAAT